MIQIELRMIKIESRIKHEKLRSSKRRYNTRKEELL